MTLREFAPRAVDEIAEGQALVGKAALKRAINIKLGSKSLRKRAIGFRKPKALPRWAELHAAPEPP